MNLLEIERRDRELRTYLNGRLWNKNSEDSLKQTLVCNSYQLLPEHPYLIENEWEVVPNRTDKGRGDLVFTDGDRAFFAVVELKWINQLDTNRNKSITVNNRKKRKKVKEQAVKYAKLFAWKEALCLEAIEAFIFTNECDRPRPVTVYY